VTAPKMLTDEERNRFEFHPATDATGWKHERARNLTHEVASNLSTLVSDGRHRSLMLTSLQEAMMWPNAAIACDTKAGA